MLLSKTVEHLLPLQIACTVAARVTCAPRSHRVRPALDSQMVRCCLPAVIIWTTDAAAAHSRNPTSQRDSSWWRHGDRLSWREAPTSARYRNTVDFFYCRRAFGSINAYICIYTYIYVLAIYTRSRCQKKQKYKFCRFDQPLKISYVK